MLLPTLRGNIWTHKTVVDYSQLLSAGADYGFEAFVTVVGSSGHYTVGNVTAGTNMVGMTATVITGLASFETSTVTAAVPLDNGTVQITVSPDFSTIRPSVSDLIVFVQYFPWKDVLLFGIPANHIVVGTKIVTLSSFSAGSLDSIPNSVFAFVGDSSVLPAFSGEFIVQFQPDADTPSTSTTVVFNPNIYIVIPGSHANGYFVGDTAVCRGQTRIITAYNGTTRVATINSPWVGFVPTIADIVNIYGPTNTDGAILVNNLNNTYGMSNLTIPSGSGDSYQYGSFRWFTFSGPGTTTYPYNRTSNQLGTPTSTYGSYCIPSRLDARDITARFCILDYTNWQFTSPGNDFATRNQALFNSKWNFNSNVTSGQVEITVQYMSL